MCCPNPCPVQEKCFSKLPRRKRRIIAHQHVERCHFLCFSSEQKKEQQRRAQRFSPLDQTNVILFFYIHRQILRHGCGCTTFRPCSFIVVKVKGLIAKDRKIYLLNLVFISDAGTSQSRIFFHPAVITQLQRKYKHNLCMLG